MTRTKTIPKSASGMSAAPFVPASHSLTRLRTAARHCEGCPLFWHATRTVFGAGPKSARVVLVGEQPGDQEDMAGKPFVGPAGRLLDELLADAGIDQSDVYVTNAVKHFKWTERGTRRLHAKPTAREVAACRPWLDAELESIQPAGVVCLGATAAQSLFGNRFRLTRQRGELLQFPGKTARWVMATYHPSAVLRAPGRAQRDELRSLIIADLTEIGNMLSGRSGSRSRRESN
jgi:DNA polymerase